MAKVNVFLTGGTGYIGGSLLSELLKDNRFEITALVRSEEKAKKLQEKGVKTVIGSIDDFDIVSSNASKADLVIETANCDHLNNAKALAAGLEKKYKETNKKGYYLHTSGSGILYDFKTIGELYPTVYDDANEEQIAAIPKNHLHREVDFHIMEHSSSYNLVVIAPTLVYGKGFGLEGIANHHSVQIPYLIKESIKAKQAVQVGNGKNVWSSVHIRDLIDLYLILINELLADKIKTLGYGYFFAENGSFVWHDVIEKVAQAGKELNAFSTSEIKIIKVDEASKDLQYMIGSNSRAKATKARQLGWNPKYDEVLESVKPEFESLLAESK